MGGRVARAFPLTPLQEGMLYHTIRDPRSGLYHVQVAVGLNGRLDEELFEEAWWLAARRHEAFRTAFVWERRERPLQVVLDEAPLDLRFLDWRGLESGVRESRWEALLDRDRRQPFDLMAPPLMRWRIIRETDTIRRVLWSVHHALVDGWSALSVLNEVLEDHEVLQKATGREGTAAGPAASVEPAVVRPSPPSYAQFVGWLEGRDEDAARTYWTNVLAGAGAPPSLPHASNRGPRGNAGIDEQQEAPRLMVQEALSEGVTATLVAAASRSRATLNTLVVGGWARVLFRRGGVDDVVFGVTHSERPPEIPGVEAAMGLYLNTVPVRVASDAGDDAGAWLRGLQQHLADGRVHGAPGLPRIQRWSGSSGRTLVTSLVVFERLPQGLSSSIEGSELQVRDLSVAGPSDVPVALLAHPGDTLRFDLLYDPRLFSHGEARELLGSFIEELTTLAEDGGTDRRFGATIDRPAPAAVREGPALIEPAMDVVARFEALALTTPDAVAVTDSTTRMTYAELDETAERVASNLRAFVDTLAVAGREVFVGLLTGRTIEGIAAMLGVLKAGYAYVPIDPDLPGPRLAKMAAIPDLVLVSSQYAAKLPSAVPRLDLDAAATTPRKAGGGTDEGTTANPAGGPPEFRTANTPAYAVFTSGSTGDPKAVVVERAHLAWSTAARLQYYEEHPGVFLLLSPITVDSATAGIYWTLCSGGTLLLPEPRAEQLPDALGSLIQSESVTHALLVPSLYGAVLDHVRHDRLGSLRVVVVAGEACRKDVVAAHRRALPRTALFNEYGPSEASVWATVDELTEGVDRPVTIGRPVPGASIRLVGLDGGGVPPGEPGEIVIAGPGVARGYLGLDDLTAKRFLNDGAGARTYRTGDRGRWSADGRLEFLGRIDDQVKVRGHRVEVGEIEGVLSKHPSVRDAAVAMIDRTKSTTGTLGEPPTWEQELTAFVVATVGGGPVVEAGSARGEDASPREPDGSELRAHLSEQLPHYMIPTRWVLVDTLPRTRAGKLDRMALLSLGGVELVGRRRTHSPPRNERERVLTRIWCDALGRDDVGVHDDFFELGGDSLLSIRVIARAGREGIAITPVEFFDAPTIARLAATSNSVPEPGDVEAEQGPVTGEGPLTPIQRWFFESVTEAPHHWNQAILLSPPPEVEADELRGAVDALLRHHDALRTRFIRRDGGWRQDVAPPSDDPPFRVVVLSDSEAGDWRSQIRTVCDAEHRSFDLEAGELFKAVLFDGDPERRRLFILTHHLVVDHVSWGILLEDLSDLVARDTGIDAGRARVLPPKTVSTLAWAEALHDAAHRDEVVALADFWTAEVDRIEDSDRDGVRRYDPDVEAPSRSGGPESFSVRLTIASTQMLLDAGSRASGATAQEVLLASVLRAWSLWSGSARVHVEVEGHGRDVVGGGPDVSRTVGWFTSVFPLVIDAGGGSVRDLVAVAGRALERLPLRGGSYGLIRYLHPDAGVRDSLARRSAPDLLFNYLGSVEGLLPADSPFEIAEESTGSARPPDVPPVYALEVNAWVAGGRLEIRATFDPGVHSPESVSRFGDFLHRTVEEIVQERGDRAERSDSAGLDASELEQLGNLLAELDEL